MRENPAAFFLVPDRFKTQKMCNEALEVDPCQVYDVPDYLETQEMCDDAVGGDSILCSLSLIRLRQNNK